MQEHKAWRNAEIYARRCSGLTLTAIARELQLSRETVREIARRMERKARWCAAQLRERKQVDTLGQSDCLAPALPRDCPGAVVFQRHTKIARIGCGIILLPSTEDLLDECRCSGTEDSS
jgi:lambda repressor-like predicted transcriptional regulator